MSSLKCSPILLLHILKYLLSSLINFKYCVIVFNSGDNDRRSFMRQQSSKIAGMFICLLVATTSVIPGIGTCIAHSADTTETTDSPFNDVAFDRKITLLMGIIGYPSLSACIIRDDQIVWSKGYGTYDRSERKPATFDTQYLLASITKTIVGTALMQLYEQGLFDLDDDVNDFLPFALRNPHFPDDPITVRMLLSHTSSLNTNEQTQYYWSNFSGDPPFEFFPELYLREFLIPGGRFYDSSVWSTEYRPGEYAMYANVGFDLISYLVEIISGEPFLAYCDTHIFSPLDMKHTGFNLSRFDISQVAVPYVRIMGRYYRITELGFLWGEEQVPPEQYWRIRSYPAGGLYSTVSDLSHFLIAHMNDGLYNGTRVLEQETVELMHAIQPGNQIGYGLAWMHTSLGSLSTSGHSGGYPGVTTWMLYNQTEDTGVICLANGSPGYLLPFAGWYLMMMILNALFTKEAPFQEKTSSEFYVSSDPFLTMPSFLSYLIPDVATTIESRI